jgi:hypothetical protein
MLTMIQCSTRHDRISQLAWRKAPHHCRLSVASASVTRVQYSDIPDTHAHEAQATQSTESLLFPANSPLASSPMPPKMDNTPAASRLHSLLRYARIRSGTFSTWLVRACAAGWMVCEKSLRLRACMYCNCWRMLVLRRYVLVLIDYDKVFRCWPGTHVVPVALVVRGQFHLPTAAGAP